MFTLDWFIKAMGAVGGVIGTALGIYNFVIARRKEKREQQKEQREREKEEKLRQEGEQDWDLYAEILAGSRKGMIFEPPNGSEDHKRVERLVDQKKLERVPGGGYAVPGQMFQVDG